MLTDTRYYEMLDVATVDCYGEEEEFSGILCTLVDNLDFPLQATLAGAPVSVHALDGGRSTLRRGIVARIERDGEAYHVSLADLVFVNRDGPSADWLEMYRRWSGTMWTRPASLSPTYTQFRPEKSRLRGSPLAHSPGKWLLNPANIMYHSHHQRRGSAIACRMIQHIWQVSVTERFYHETLQPKNENRSGAGALPRGNGRTA